MLRDSRLSGVLCGFFGRGARNKQAIDGVLSFCGPGDDVRMAATAIPAMESTKRRRKSVNFAACGASLFSFKE